MSFFISLFPFFCLAFLLPLSFCFLSFSLSAVFLYVLLSSFFISSFLSDFLSVFLSFFIFHVFFLSVVLLFLSFWLAVSLPGYPRSFCDAYLVFSDAYLAFLKASPLTIAVHMPFRTRI